MTASLSQHLHRGSTGGAESAPVITLGSNTASGDTVVVWACLDRNPTSVSVSGLGATWTRLQHVDNTPTLGAYYQLWVGVGCTAGNTAITFTLGGGAFFEADAQVWAGAPAVLSSAISAVTTSATIITPSISSTASGQALAGFHGQFQSRTYTYTDTAGAWTIADDTFYAPMAIQMHSAYRVSAEAATQQHQSNASGSSEWVSAVALLGTAPPPSPPIRRPVVAGRVATQRASLR